jgi:hypothetical protein
MIDRWSGFEVKTDLNLLLIRSISRLGGVQPFREREAFYVSLRAEYVVVRLCLESDQGSAGKTNMTEAERVA